MNGYVFTLLFVPLIAFVVIVLPTWITLYYRDRNRSSRELSNDEWDEIRRIVALSERLEPRITALESILESDHTGWRNQT